MPPSPRPKIEDGYIAGRACAICGANALAVKRIAGVPDHVACGQCGSVFVLEAGGERVMYGKIPPEYPATRRFALKQWTWLEAVDRRASPERPAASLPPAAGLPPAGLPPAAGLPSAPAIAAPPTPAPKLPRITPSGAPLTPPPSRPPTTPPPAAQQAPRPGTTPPPAAYPPSRPAPPRQPQAVPVVLPPGLEPMEPAPGERFRVVIRGERIGYPASVCAHCLRSPTSGRLAVISRVARGRRTLTFNVPLCESCLHRAAARPAGEKGARLQAHLIAVLIGMVVVVGALLSGLVNPVEDLLTSGFMLLILGILGYGVPAFLLLSRVSRGQLPADALYVRTTLRIPPDTPGTEVAFEWRNPRYAELFRTANRDWAVGAITPVADPVPAPPEPAPANPAEP